MSTDSSLVHTQQSIIIAKLLSTRWHHTGRSLPLPAWCWARYPEQPCRRLSNWLTFGGRAGRFLPTTACSVTDRTKELPRRTSDWMLRKLPFRYGTPSAGCSLHHPRSRVPDVTINNVIDGFVPHRLQWEDVCRSYAIAARAGRIHRTG